MKRFLAFFILLPFCSHAQTPNRYMPYSFDFTQRIENCIYDTRTSFHSAIKPLFTDDPLLAAGIDSFFNYAADSVDRTWAHRKLFHEHLVEMNRDEYTVYADYLPDLQVGRESEHTRKTWLNTRGFQLGATIGKKFSLYTSLYENQARLPGYLDRMVTADSIIPGQSIESHLLANRTRGAADWSYSTANLSYTPVKYINLQLGYDKNFIGDGYRSMLLSDLAANYPFFKATFTLGAFSYMSMWAQMEDLHAPKLSYENGYRKKWAVFHYLDWNISNRVSVGLFESVIWQAADATGKRGFDFSYLNPVLLLRTVERQNGSPDNALVGLNTSYEALRGLTLYGQFILDELSASEFIKGDGYWANKWSMQLGLRGSEPFGLKGLHYLAEFNTARPYMYSEAEPINNYAHYSQPLAHPFGANFREFVTVWSYGYKRFVLNAQYNKALYGLDAGGVNVGHDIYRSYDTRGADYGNTIGQGLRTDFRYTDLRLSYLIKPRLNFRVEAGLVTRTVSSSAQHEQTSWFTLGLRSSFRNLYQDF
jgi:hypothetical protein